MPSQKILAIQQAAGLILEEWSSLDNAIRENEQLLQNCLEETKEGISATKAVTNETSDSIKSIASTKLQFQAYEQEKTELWQLIEALNIELGDQFNSDSGNGALWQGLMSSVQLQREVLEKVESPEELAKWFRNVFLKEVRDDTSEYQDDGVHSRLDTPDLNQLIRNILYEVSIEKSKGRKQTRRSYPNPDSNQKDKQNQ